MNSIKVGIPVENVHTTQVGEVIEVFSSSVTVKVEGEQSLAIWPLSDVCSLIEEKVKESAPSPAL